MPFQQRSPRRLRPLLGFASAAILLSSCTLKREEYMYNNTGATITVGSSRVGKQKTISPYTFVNLNGVQGLEVERGGRTYRFQYPFTPIPPLYERGNGFELTRRFEYGDDNRIYILPNNVSPSSHYPAQPASFPLSPSSNS